MEWFDWINDPTAWLGLATLVLLEIVLGIDNLIFIAILADKLPPHQRDRARVIGLSLALLMRLGLLTIMSWLVTLTAPLFSVGPVTFSGRDLILFVGGLFLLFKATTELHERLEGTPHTSDGSRTHLSFGVVVLQIVVLDAVFSLDAVITAVGMVDQLAIMMIAVIIAMVGMLIASKPLTRFVNAHPTVVVLCLAFLLMIGLSLVADGLGFHIPKGYLYAAIAFSILIESFNQIARRNFLRLQGTRPLRERTAQAVLTLLRAKHSATDETTPASEATVSPDDDSTGYAAEERNMVTGVLTLVDRSVHSLMTPRGDISWVNLQAPPDTIRQLLIDTPHSFFPVCRGTLDEIIGMGRARDMLVDLLTHGSIRTETLRTPIIVHEAIGILNLIDTLRRSRGQLVLVVNEFGAIEGLVTPMDLFEAIAGEFPDEDETPTIIPQGEGSWQVAGSADLQHLEQVTDTYGLVSDEYASVGGYLMARFDALPETGQVLEATDAGLRFEVLEANDRRILLVRVDKLAREVHSETPE